MENERLDFLLSVGPAVTYSREVSGNKDLRFISKNVRSQIGYESKDFLTDPIFWVDHIHPEDRERAFEALTHVIETGWNFHEYRFLRKDGNYRFLRDESKLSRDENGKPLEIVGYLLDITEFKDAEEKIRHAAEEWRTTFDCITDYVSIVDTDFTIVRANRALSNALKVKPQEIVGKKCYELFHRSERPPEDCPFKYVLKTKRPIIMETYEPRLGGYLEISCSPIFDKDGVVAGVVHLAKDITERKEMEKTRRLSQLGKLVADMAHEVNNPLMVISGRAQLALMENIQNEEVKNNLDLVVGECQRAKDIIERLLRFSRPSKGKPVAVDINKAIDDILKIVEHQFELSNINIKRNYTAGLSSPLGDEQQLHEVFMNLLNNANEAMPDGGTIEITTRFEDGHVRIELHDTGHGISMDVMPHILDPFFTTKKKGTGLGLSVCYSIIQAHGGKLRFESSPGQGTTAIILLPEKGAKGDA